VGKFFADLLLLTVELVRQPFEEQHPEDEFLELRGIHIPAQDVARLEQPCFQPSERELLGLLLRLGDGMPFVAEFELFLQFSPFRPDAGAVRCP